MEDDPQKREIVNRRHFSFRLNLFFFITFFLFSVLIVRLAILQFVEGPTLREEETRISNKPVLIPPIRGNIYDSSGQPIAYSTSTQTLYYTIEPGAKIADSEAMAKRLLKVFESLGNPAHAMTLEEIIKNMDLNYRQNTVSVPRRIKSGLTNREIAFFLENRDQFKGVDILEESIRHYDKDTIAVQLVGYLKKFKGVSESSKYYKDKDKKDVVPDDRVRYLQQEDVGFDGLERLYQEELRGKNGIKNYPINSQGRIIGLPEITKPVKGNNLYLTINRNVQLKTEKAITDHLHYLQTTYTKDRQPHAKIGFAVAMEVHTGKVIAMASMPDYDPNIWEGGGIGTEDYNKIENMLPNGTISTMNGPYKTAEELGKHPSSILPPGSTLKPLSVLIGLNEKLFRTTDRWTDPGVYYYGKEGTHRRPIRNAQGHAYGSLDPALAIGKSSNPWMAKMIGDALYFRDGNKGVELWDNYMKQFGLGVLTGSGLLNESKGVIEYFHEMEVASSQSALILASFGQQAKYTTLQLAQYTAMLANRGKRMKPQFVNEIRDAEGNVVKKFEPEVLNTIDIPEAYWKEVETGMSLVNVDAFKDAPYKVLRKTGTSEQSVAGGVKKDNAVFIAYAPAENPVIAVAVVVPEGGFGGKGAAPIARKIFDAYDEEIGLHGTPKKAASQTDNKATGTE